MSRNPSRTPIWGWQKTRWLACFALALSFHGAGAAALLARWTDENDLAPNAAVITIDLAPMAVAPTATPTDAPPDQIDSRQQEAEPEPTPEKPVEEVKIEPEPAPEKPPEKVEIPPDNTPKPELAVMPPPKPQEKKRKPKKMASVAAKTNAADQKAERAAAPTPGAHGNPNAIPNWMSQVFSQIARHKRAVNDAPAGAVAWVSFSVDRSGGVHNVRVTRSSGSQALDHEANAIVTRAAPLPPPPPEKPGAHIPLTVPVRHTGR